MSILKSKKGFQLSIRMIVVIILGIVILGVGVSLFYQGYGRISELRENVDSQTQAQLNALMDDGSLVVIPFSTKNAKRGRDVDFDIGINNGLGKKLKFKILISYAGSSAYKSLNPDAGTTDPFLAQKFCGYITNTQKKKSVSPNSCGDAWVLIGNDAPIVANNERAYVPIKIVLPKKNILPGEYVFNVDVCRVNITDSARCNNLQTFENRVGSRQKLYVVV